MEHWRNSLDCRLIYIGGHVFSSNMKIDMGKESVDVCLAIQEIREEGKMEGIIEGAITFAQKLGVQKEQVKQSIMEEYDKDDKEAEELINAYWK